MFEPFFVFVCDKICLHVCWTRSLFCLFFFSDEVLSLFLTLSIWGGDNVIDCLFKPSSSSFYWDSMANAPNVLQPYWLIVVPLHVPDLTASLLLWGPSGQRWRYLWAFLFSNVPTFATSRLQGIPAAKGETNGVENGRWILPENARLPRNIQGSFTCRKSTTWGGRL